MREGTSAERSGRHAAPPGDRYGNPDLGPEPFSWASVLSTHFREIFFAGGGVVVGVGAGAHTLFAPGHSTGTRVLGVLLIFGGLLLFASYYLHLAPGPLSLEFWNASRARRAARWVLDYTWLMYFATLGVAWVVLFIDHAA